MHGNLPAASAAAIIPADTFVVEKRTGDTSVVDDENWFADATLQLLGADKPGTALDCVTDFQFGERNCQRYAAGHVKPAAYFLRALLRGPHGRQWLFATMDDCTADWWVDFQRHERMGSAAEAVR